MHKALIIYAHPHPESFNHAILETVQDELSAHNIEARTQDLYAMGFNPVLSAEELGDRDAVPEDIRAIQQDILWADTLIFIYPIWWTGQPAILKGWFDRCFTNGFAFSVKNGWKGLLTPRKAIVIQTTGAGEEELTNESYKKNVDAFQCAIREGSLHFSGITDITIKTLHGVIKIDDAKRQQMLDEVQGLL